MSLSRWWREWQFESAFRRAIRADLARIGKEYEAKFKVLATGNDFDAPWLRTSRHAACLTFASRPSAAGG